MKFKNVSKEIKHIKVDGAWLTVKPGDVFEVNQTLGRLHLDPGLSKVGEKKEKVTLEKATGQAKPEKPEPKEVMDVSGLDDKSKARVKDLKDDLADDGKRNRSHKKPKSKTSS